MLGLTFSSKLDWGSYIIFIAKTASKKIGAFVRSANVDSLSLFYRFYFARCSSKLAELVPLPYSRRRYTCYSDRYHDFSVTVPRCYKDLNNFFHRTARFGVLCLHNTLL